MDTTLAALCTADLNATARLLAVYCYANADAAGAADLDLAEVCAACGIGPAKLRTYRAQLATLGILASHLAGEVLHIQFAAAYCPEQRAATARSAAASAPQERVQRADPARSGAESAPPRRDQRAPTARYAQPERESRAPVQGIVKVNNNNQELVVVKGGMQGGGRTAELLRAAGVRAALADRFAGQLSLEAAARHVAAWQVACRANPALNAGALVTRLRDWDIPSSLSYDGLQAGILAAHITAEDLHSWGLQRQARPHRQDLDGYDVPAEYAHLVHH